MRAILGAATLLAVGCKNDQGFAEIEYDGIAVVTGDFDDVEASLTRLDIGYTPFEGYISAAVYDPEIKPDAIGLKVEDLFLGQTDGANTMRSYGAVFVNSGARGLGEYVYNGVDEDSSLVLDPDALANVEDYVRRGGALVVSDWAYDLVEAVWPDQIDFVRDDAVLDDAQNATSEGVSASVLDPSVQLELGDITQVQLQYDFAHWAAIESVASDVTVYLKGDITYRVNDAEGDVTLAGSPLLVGFPVDKGVVLYSTFHWRAQTAEVADALLVGSLEGLNPGSGGSTAGEQP